MTADYLLIDVGNGRTQLGLSTRDALLDRRAGSRLHVHHLRDAMNTYQTKFFATCPNNGIRISYDLSIHTTDVLPVEQIVAAVHGLGDKFHETLADERYIKIAVGRDYDDVAPVRGSYHGSGHCKMSVTVEVEKVE